MTPFSKLTEEIRKGPQGPQVAAFFDLDRTLVEGFSATTFMRERLMSGRMSPKEMAGTFLGALSFGFGRTGFSDMMSGMSASYQGLAESVLEDVGEEVFDRELVHQIYPESRALVEAHQAAGHTVGIISSAMRYQVMPFARELAIDHVRVTELEVEGGVLTGRVLRPTCYGEGKAIAAREIALKTGSELARSYFYSDSHEDLPLLEVVGHPRPLNPNRTLAQIAKERQWPVRHFDPPGAPALADVVRTGLGYASAGPALGAGFVAGVLNGSYREGMNVSGAVWSDLATSLAGIDLRIEGEENAWAARPSVFVFNHEKSLDRLLMLKIVRRDMAIAGRAEQKDDPVLGPLFSAAGVVFLDPDEEATEAAPEGMMSARRALREGRSIIIASERKRATRAGGPASRRFGDFDPEAFRLAIAAEVPIVPVVFRNVARASSRDPGILRPATVDAVVLPPIDTRGRSEETLDELISHVESQFEELLGRSA